MLINSLLLLQYTVCQLERGKTQSVKRRVLVRTQHYEVCVTSPAWWRSRFRP